MNAAYTRNVSQEPEQSPEAAAAEAAGGDPVPGPDDPNFKPTWEQQEEVVKVFDRVSCAS